ncbi:MAG: PGPGW domain-containing protein [Thermoleophilaceae bacterium]
MASPPTPHREQEQPEPEEDKPELLVKLQERKERHSERGLPARIGAVVLGVVLVLAGIVLSGPGVPGPGFLVILIGLSFLALEFDRAERLLEKAIVAADRAKDRAENASRTQKIAMTTAGLLALGAFVAAAILWDIPLLPV